MHRSNVLVMIVDGLRASALGAYGNTTFPTPALDRFAAESWLFDECYAPSTELSAIYRALWNSKHPARSLQRDGELASERASSPGLASHFARLGYVTALVTDDRNVIEFEGAANFNSHVLIESPDALTAQVNRAAGDEVTQLARLFVAASEAIATPAGRGAQPSLVCVHARGLYGPWDAPLEWQESLLSEDDPPPVDSVAPPDLVVPSQDGPDEAFRFATAYAAQVMVLDACWQGLMEVVESAQGGAPWLVMLAGARGFPLGEHGRIGGVDSRLYAEQLHVPWLIRFPDGRGRLARSGRLVSHLNVLPTLLDWANDESAKENSAFDGRSILPLTSDNSTAGEEVSLAIRYDGTYSIRTDAWSLREGPAKEVEQPPELFVRPDDRWEANDVAKLCSEEVEQLQAAAAEVLCRYGAGAASGHR